MKIPRTTLEIYIVTLVTGSIIVATMMGSQVFGLFVLLFWMAVAAIWLSIRKRKQTSDTRSPSNDDQPEKPQ